VRGLQYSRSSTDLSDLGSPGLISKGKLGLGEKGGVGGLHVDGAGSSTQKRDVRASRPSVAKLRRRSTLQWTGASPLMRQKKLEDISSARMVDSFFSLHCAGIDTPVYISEVITHAMNPSFRFFDLDPCGPHVTRLNEVTVKYWTRKEGTEECTLLVELYVNLRSLQFIGKSLENFKHPLPGNCVIFHLTDGIYTSFTDLPPSEPVAAFSLQSRRTGKQEGVHAQPTASYDALMKLANLDDCIQDALATRAKLEEQINSILASNQSSLNAISVSGVVQEDLSATKRAVAAERKLLRTTTKKREDLKTSLTARREAMAKGRSVQERALSYLQDAQTNLQDCKTLLQASKEEASGQIRRICEDLQAIFPIEPIPGKPLCFTIRGLHLPNSSALSDRDSNAEAIAAALGHVAQLMYLLSFYLSVPLPFPIKPFSSRSFIQDPIASTIPDTQRIYPLYPGVQFRFDYGVFLLNKDVEFLLGRQGLRILDPRHTLPNLKYLLYVLTAGTGELPTRKAGGVRGLLAGRATPRLSRQGSADSAVSDGGRLFGQVSEGVVAGNGGMGKGKGKEKEGTGQVGSARKTPQPPVRNTFPIRSSGLREAA
jgi:hypothetical protein